MNSTERERIEQAIKQNFDNIASIASRYDTENHTNDDAFYYWIINNSRSGFEARVRRSAYSGQSIEDSFKNMFPKSDSSEDSK